MVDLHLREIPDFVIRLPSGAIRCYGVRLVFGIQFHLIFFLSDLLISEYTFQMR